MNSKLLHYVIDSVNDEASICRVALVAPPSLHERITQREEAEDGPRVYGDGESSLVTWKWPRFAETENNNEENESGATQNLAAIL